MSKASLTVLLFVLLFVGGIVYLEFAVPKQERVVHGPAVRVVDKDLDTLYQIRLKYKTLHDIDTQLITKYDTLYLSIAGDTSCGATLRLIAMHRQLDSSGK
jgi:hypothetical protein